MCIYVFMLLDKFGTQTNKWLTLLNDFNDALKVCIYIYAGIWVAQVLCKHAVSYTYIYIYVRICARKSVMWRIGHRLSKMTCESS